MSVSGSLTNAYLSSLFTVSARHRSIPLRCALHQPRSLVRSTNRLCTRFRCPGCLGTRNRRSNFHLMEERLRLRPRPALPVVETINLNRKRSVAISPFTNSIPRRWNVQHRRQKSSNVRVRFAEHLFLINDVVVVVLLAEYATQAFDVVKLQEQTKQLELQKQMKVRRRRNGEAKQRRICLGIQSTRRRNSFSTSTTVERRETTDDARGNSSSERSNASLCEFNRSFTFVSFSAGEIPRSISSKTNARPSGRTGDESTRRVSLVDRRDFSLGTFARRRTSSTRRLSEKTRRNETT